MIVRRDMDVWRDVHVSTDHQTTNRRTSCPGSSACPRVPSCVIVRQAHILPRLAAAGFEGVYKCKTRESMGATGKVDGCALLWRRSKFRLVEQYAVEFNEASEQRATTAAARTTVTTSVARRLRIWILSSSRPPSLHRVRLSRGRIVVVVVVVVVRR